MDIIETEIEGVFILQRNSIGDDRGNFSRLFCKEELRDILGKREIKQINHSYTKEKGSIRGMHYQKPPHAEMKIITCIRGRVLDFAIDIRRDSKYFLKSVSVELSADNNQSFIIPEGFAHGFQVLEPDSELIYCHTEFYNPDHEAGLRFDDPKLNLSWPLPPQNLSERDLSHQTIDDHFKGISV